MSKPSTPYYGEFGFENGVPKPTREEAVALYSEVMARHDCQTLGEMAEHFSHAVLERWGQ